MEGMVRFSPNYATHPEFGKVLREVRREGVGILVYGCRVTEDSLTIDGTVPLVLER